LAAFEFRQTPVYAKSKLFRAKIKSILAVRNIEYELKDQINRAAISVILNLAEGYGRYHKADKRNFYINARASVYECVACLDLIFDNNIESEILDLAEELARMLSGLIQRFKVET